jgi:hypothetical protein
MKIRKQPCAENIGLFYSMVTLIILLCITKHNHQNNPTQFSKDFLCHGENITLPLK